MENFTPISSALGGVLIGLSATTLMLTNGRVAGISGIFGGILPGGAQEGDRLWRALFVAGLLVGGVVMLLLQPGGFEISIQRSLPLVLVAGLLVGFGTRLGSGCTSGHGVCGLSRFSTRSLTATLTFIATGAVTVFLTRVLGGAS